MTGDVAEDCRERVRIPLLDCCDEVDILVDRVEFAFAFALEAEIVSLLPGCDREGATDAEIGIGCTSLGMRIRSWIDGGLDACFVC